MAQLGDTFLLANPGINSHLFVIISDPAADPEHLVIASFTSWRADKDQSCVVEAGEHPFAKKRSCVYYGQDRLMTLGQYEACLASASITPHQPVTGELLDRVLDGAAISPHLPLGSREILAVQGLIDPE